MTDLSISSELVFRLGAKGQPEVKARNHSFSGGRDELLKDLDAALDWVEANAAAR